MIADTARDSSQIFSAQVDATEPPNIVQNSTPIDRLAHGTGATNLRAGDHFLVGNNNPIVAGGEIPLFENDSNLASAAEAADFWILNDTVGA